MTVELARRLFTVDEYHRMAEVGILTRRDRVELIDGGLSPNPISFSSGCRSRSTARQFQRLPMHSFVVEVADTSLHRDREVKLPHYAVVGIPETWIVDLDGGAIEVYQEPSREGCKVVRRLERGAVVAPAAFPDIVLPVAEILG